MKVLVVIWEDHGRMCGKLLAPLIRSMIDFLAASTKPDYGISDDIRGMLLRASPVEVDILLKSVRKAREITGMSTTWSAQTPIRAQLPVQTHFDRDTLTPDSSRLTR